MPEIPLAKPSSSKYTFVFPKRIFMILSGYSGPSPVFLSSLSVHMRLKARVLALVSVLPIFLHTLHHQLELSEAQS